MRDAFISWTDDLTAAPARFENDGAVTVDAATLVDMIRATVGPNGLGQYLDDAAVIQTVLGLSSLPVRADGRRDIVPLAGAITETAADGTEVAMYADVAELRASWAHVDHATRADFGA